MCCFVNVVSHILQIKKLNITINIYLLLNSYFAIINPLGGETKWMILNFGPIKHRKKLFIMMTIWLVGILSGSVQFFYTRVVPFPYGSKTLYDCRENLPKRYAKVYTIYLFVGTFGFPLLILVYVYSIIGYHVWRHVAPGNPHHSRDHNNSLTREKVSKITNIYTYINHQI